MSSFLKYDFRGNYDIIIGTNSVGKYEGTGSFGELALMYNTPRAATIKAITNGTLWSLVSPFLRYPRKYRVSKIKNS